MHDPTVDYKMSSSYPPINQRMRRKKKSGGCACDGNYAKSLQGICKFLSLLVGLLAFIIVGVSPYWRAIFVLEGVTWPFHIVMLLTIVVWLATAFMYCFFLSGQHLEYPHLAWPTIELRFNIAMVLIVVFDAMLEATNVWRWDMTRGYSIGARGGAIGGSLNPYGYSPGMTFSQSINMNSYCTRYPRDCTEYFALLTGNNSYYGNHIFATILLFILLIMYLVSTYFSFRTWRVFKRDMTNGMEENRIPKPSAWQRFRFRISEIKVPMVTAANIRGRFDKMMNGRAVPESDDEDGTVDINLTEMDDLRKKVPSSPGEEMNENRSHHASSVYSGGHKSSRSHHSSHHGRSSERRSRSSSNSRKRKDDHHRHPDDRRSEKSHPSSRSPRSGATSRSSHRPEHHRSSNKSKPEEKDSMVIDMKAIGNDRVDGQNGPASPVASVMC